MLYCVLPGCSADLQGMCLWPQLRNWANFIAFCETRLFRSYARYVHVATALALPEQTLF